VYATVWRVILWQAVRESEELQVMIPNVQRCIAATIDKIETLSNEEKLTNFVRKKIHSAINERTQEVINKLVEQLQQYAETLHQQVTSTPTIWVSLILKQNNELLAL